MGLIKNEFLTKKYWIISLIILIIAFALTSIYTYQRLNTPQYIIQTQSIDLGKIECSFKHEALVKNPNPLWPQGTILSNQSLYFLKVSPELRGIFYLKISTPYSTDITIDIKLKKILSCEERGSSYWSKEEILWTETIEEVKEFIKEFSINLTEIKNLIREMRESLDFYRGETKLQILATISYQGKIQNKEIKGEKQCLLLIELQDSYYKVSVVPFEEKIKDEKIQRIQISLPIREKIISLTLPGILLASIISLVVVKLRYKPLAREEIEKLKREREYQKFKDEISLGEYPGDSPFKVKIKVNSLRDLIAIAVDGYKRVIYDEEKKIYFVVDGEILYYYTP